MAAVKFIELGEREVEEVRHVLAEENFFSRTLRHLVELKVCNRFYSTTHSDTQDLPAYLYRFARRLTSTSYASKLYTSPLNATNLHRDQFGLQKLLVAVAKSGKVFALDSSNGEIVWSRSLGLTSHHGSELDVKGMWIVREEGEGVNPTLAVIASRMVEGVSKVVICSCVMLILQEVSTVGYHIDAFTGEVDGKQEGEVKRLGKVLFEGKAESVFLTPFTHCGTNNRVLAIMDGVEKVHIFPSCLKVAKDLEGISKEFFFTTTTRSLSGSILEGRVLSSREGTKFTSTVVWSTPFSNGEVLASTTPVSFDAVASYGRAVGDKSTLYKYLNPHLLVASVLDASKKSAKVIVLDSSTGRKVHEIVLQGVVTEKGVQTAMSENWLVYSYLDTQGWRIGSVELYEDRRSGKADT